jgi:hypothetical protein
LNEVEFTVPLEIIVAPNNSYTIGRLPPFDSIKIAPVALTHSDGEAVAVINSVFNDKMVSISI